MSPVAAEDEPTAQPMPTSEGELRERYGRRLPRLDEIERVEWEANRWRE